MPTDADGCFPANGIWCGIDPDKLEKSSTKNLREEEHDRVYKLQKKSKGSKNQKKKGK